MKHTVKRLLVEKSEPYAVEAAGIFADLRENLGLTSLTGVRLFNRYDISGLDDEQYVLARDLVFSEPPVDLVYEERLPDLSGAFVFAMEYIPGQYDQRADSAAQCVQAVTQQERPLVRTAKVIAAFGIDKRCDQEAIKTYLINPVETREATMAKPVDLEDVWKQPEDVAVFTDFTTLDDDALESLRKELGLAMTREDFAFCQAYFAKTEKRAPTITEIRVLDTYWSDHCRHTTFNTVLDKVTIEAADKTAIIARAWDDYSKNRQAYYGEKAKTRPVTLMDMAVLAMKELRAAGKLPDLDQSEEINACSIVVPVEIDGQTEEWLVMFKNETHNHPTEIEPFGGAATCLGGAIRDPLSGRAYVYQAMRVTGSGDPRQGVADTLKGKLPQRKITVGAASGYSSYGNQIGLATGHVQEYYHPNFVAKRMEVGAVIGAAPKKQVYREQPQPGDVVLLVGGRTGRDGCGGATGSSKEHDLESLATCGAEVQKGNPPTERKLQRLFRNPVAARMIKRCNDFGAGGVSVAIGELTDGLVINLDAVPKKYEGLDGTELSISESQERMALVVAAADAKPFIAMADEENVEATLVAVVTDKNRLQMDWRGKRIVDLDRAFLDTNGVQAHSDAHVTAPSTRSIFAEQTTAALPTLADAWVQRLGDLSACSQKGLAERFDSTVGAATVLMPFGGARQLSPQEGMAAKLPVGARKTNAATIMACGYNPRVASWSPFHGAAYAVLESAARIVALGGDYRHIRLSFQEYFEKLGDQADKWGKPLAALLGAYWMQKGLGIAAIGGKDSMSGSFMDLSVPPTLISFAVAPIGADQVVSAEFKQANRKLVLLSAACDADGMPDFAALDARWRLVAALAGKKKILSAGVLREGGLAMTLSRMCFGNWLGCRLEDSFAQNPASLFEWNPGALLLETADQETADPLLAVGGKIIGTTTNDDFIAVGEIKLPLANLLNAWEAPLAKIFPAQTKALAESGTQACCHTKASNKAVIRRTLPVIAKPRVVIPVFPGSNCEFDSASAFERAGAQADVFVLRNLTPQALHESIVTLAEKISGAQMLMLPGGFSAGDEPDGSGKFIAAIFHAPRLKEAVANLLQKQDGLILGVCNGFQALIKLGLVPYGKIVDLRSDSPTLTFNRIGRHMSSLVETKIVSNRSPWLQLVDVGDRHMIPISHGEGRFVASESEMAQLFANGQVATQYVDGQGNPAANMPWNPNGSLCAVEGILSPDGRVLGKMGHSERIGDNLLKNVPGEKDQHIFLSGVRYFQ